MCTRDKRRVRHLKTILCIAREAHSHSHGDTTGYISVHRELPRLCRQQFADGVYHTDKYVKPARTCENYNSVVAFVAMLFPRRSQTHLQVETEYPGGSRTSAYITAPPCTLDFQVWKQSPTVNNSTGTGCSDPISTKKGIKPEWVATFIVAVFLVAIIIVLILVIIKLVKLNKWPTNSRINYQGTATLSRKKLSRKCYKL